MIGFELNIKGEIISAALENGVVSIIATKVLSEMMDSIDLDFAGLNTTHTEYDESIDWYKTNLKEGDEFTVKVKNIVKNSKPKEIRKKKRNSIIERKLKSYNALKKELEEKGFI